MPGSAACGVAAQPAPDDGAGERVCHQAGRVVPIEAHRTLVRDAPARFDALGWYGVAAIAIFTLLLVDHYLGYLLG